MAAIGNQNNLEAGLRESALQAYIEQLSNRLEFVKDWTDRARQAIAKYAEEQRRANEQAEQWQRQAVGFTGASELYRKAVLAGQRESVRVNISAANSERAESVRILEQLVPEAEERTKLLDMRLEFLKRAHRIAS